MAFVFVCVTSSCRCQCVRPNKNLMLSLSLLLTDIFHRCAALSCSSVGTACNSLNRGSPPTSAVKVCACGTRQPRWFSLHHASVLSSCSTPFFMSGSFSCGRVHVAMLSQCFLVVFPQFFNISIPHTQHVRIPTPHKIIPRWQVFERCHCEAFRARPCDEWKPVFRSRSEAFPPHEIDDNPLLQSEAPCSVTLDLFIPGARVTDTEARAAGLGSEANVEGSDARVTSSTFSGSSSLPLLIPRAFL